MKKGSDVRLQLANKDGMPDELFKDFQTIQTERFKEIRNFLVAEYFVRFHNEIHFDSANTLAVIETQISCRFDEARRIENLKRFGEEFFTEEEDYEINKYDSLGFINTPDVKISFEDVESSFEKVFNNHNSEKSDIVAVIKKYVPDFMHIETGKHLDQKM